MSIKLLMLSNHLILCHPLLLCLQSFPASGSFPRSLFFSSGSRSIGVSASTSVLPMTIQSWFPLGWTGLISLQSKGLSNTTTLLQHHSSKTSIEIKCTINVMHLNHPKAIPHLICGKIIFHGTSPWCQKFGAHRSKSSLECFYAEHIISNSFSH